MEPVLSEINGIKFPSFLFGFLSTFSPSSHSSQWILCLDEITFSEFCSPPFFQTLFFVKPIYFLNHILFSFIALEKTKQKNKQKANPLKKKQHTPSHDISGNFLTLF